MGILVNINGEIHPPEGARISIFDRQFLYGDGVYETVRTYGGRLFMARAHFRRLERSAQGVAIPLPWDEEALRAEIERTIQAADNPESIARIMLTRGEGEFGLDPSGADRPNWIVIVRPLAPVDPGLKETGVDVVIPSIRRTSPRALASHIKSGNYLNQTLALAEGRKSGAFEVVMLDEEGHLTEGSTSNVFFVKGGTLYTPSIAAGVLPGITRSLVLGLAARMGIPTGRGLYPEGELTGADEAFITATIKEILPIRRVDGRRVGAEVPGPVTRRVLEAYATLTARAAAGALPDDEVEGLLAAGRGEIE